MAATWEIAITEDGNDSKVTSEITTTATNYVKSDVETYNGSSQNIPEAVQQDLENSGIEADVVQVLFLEPVATGQGNTSISITAPESEMLSEDPEGTSNGVVVVYNDTSSAVLGKKKTGGKIKLGTSNPS